jgi:hypothetical protein
VAHVPLNRRADRTRVGRCAVLDVLGYLELRRTNEALGVSLDALNYYT